MSKTVKNKAYLVGAGPGSADLITVRGAELLRAADCIIYDKLANPALLKFARPEAEIIHVPKRAGGASVTQNEINRLLVEKANEGKTVVRLKGGDPCIFGRCAEEMTVLAEAGIDFEIVPGVTAAIAAAAYTGILLTDRDYSSQVVFVTGREAEDKTESNIDWSWLAKFTGNIVLYMAVGALESIAHRLIEAGMNPRTPAAVVADATLPTQKTTRAPLNLIAETCKREKIEPPAIIIIGPAADSDARFDWLKRKPLFGVTIVVTRDTRGNADFAEKIVRRAAVPLNFPTIEIKPLTHKNAFLKTLSKITGCDWVVFTSPNGVTIFFEALRSLAKDCRALASAKIAAVGSETAAKLREFGITADFVPTVFTGKELARQLTAFTNLRDKKILLLRSDAASKELPDLLHQAEAQIDDVPIYTIAPVKADAAQLADQIAAGRIHWLTFASPSAAEVFFEQLSPRLVNSSPAKVASIGPTTSDRLRTLAVKIDLQADLHTIDGLLDAIEEAQR